MRNVIAMPDIFLNNVISDKFYRNSKFLGFIVNSYKRTQNLLIYLHFNALDHFVDDHVNRFQEM